VRRSFAVILALSIFGCGGAGDGAEDSLVSGLGNLGPEATEEAGGEIQGSGDGSAVESEEGETTSGETSGEEGGDGLCSAGTFACQAGVLSECVDGAWVEKETCDEPLDCDPNGGSCGGCTPSCEGKDCGDNGCGNSCGKCGEAASCNDGTCVEDDSGSGGEVSGEEGGEGSGEEGGEGPGEEGGASESGGGSGVVCDGAGIGKNVGDYSKNIAWKDSNDEWFELHSLCGEELVVVIESADW
jgi:hypothetical protein